MSRITEIDELAQIDNHIPDSTTVKDITGADRAGTTVNKKGCHKIPRYH